MPKPQLEKTLKLKLDQIQFSTIENFAQKKMHFGQISQTRKLDEFWANFLKPKKLNLKNFLNFETQKTQTRTPKRRN